MSDPETGEIERPSADEYDPYYQAYVDKVPQGPILTTLETQARRVSDLLANLDEIRAGYRYAPERWSIKEVFGHLLDSERVFAFRALWFARDQAAPLPDMDPDAFVVAADLDGRSVAQIASECDLVRRSTVELFRSFSETQLLRRGTASGREFTARAIAFVLAGHERHHLEVLAERYDFR